MKKILMFLFLIIPFILNGTTWYCAPTTATPAGSDANAGTIDAPMFTLNHAWTHVVAGDTVLLRGGVYSFLSQQSLNGSGGTITDTICIFNYPSEVPVFTKDASYVAPEWPYALILLNDDYIYFKGIEIRGYTQENAGIWSAFFINDSNHNTFEQLNLHHNGGGILLYRNSNENYFHNCDIHHNYDPLSALPYGNADGIGIEHTPSDYTNTIRGCRLYYNSDDGLDCWASDGMVIVDSCWVWMNGYREDHSTEGGNGNGLKLGSTTSNMSTVFRRKVTNNIFFNNRMNGITQNMGNCRVWIYNNTFYDNQNCGLELWWYNLPHIIRNNVSFGNDNENYWGNQTNATIDHNSYDDIWQPLGPVASSADFVSVDTAGVSGARQSNGSLPVLTFLHLVTGSDLKDVGIYVDIPYYGSNPDLGAFEFFVAPLMNRRKTLIIIR